MRGDHLAIVCDFWVGNPMSKSFTISYIALIPKKDNQDSFLISAPLVFVHLSVKLSPKVLTFV